MEQVLSGQALKELNNNGFVRTNIKLSSSLISAITRHFHQAPRDASNWSYFVTSSLEHYRFSGFTGLKHRLSRFLKARELHRSIRQDRYNKTLFGTSELLPEVMQYCLDQGLGRFLGSVPLLVGHDIFLEVSREQNNFGFHEDGFGWEIFYQSGDDVSLYIPLVELNANNGGRLVVEQHADKSARYRDWNRRILEFSEYCRSMGAVDQNGLVSKQSILHSPRRRQIADKYWSLIGDRKKLSRPKSRDMAPVDCAEGEVILFNNKRYHDIEAWSGDHFRSIYIIRCFPTYDFNMHPPRTFLNQAPCNRYQLHPGDNGLASFTDRDTIGSHYPPPVD